MFVVQLIAIELVDNITDTMPPSLGSDTISTVTVSPNDYPQGVIGFESAMYARQVICVSINYIYIYRFNVSEDIGQFDLTVVRNQGAFGEVSVFYGIININANAMGGPADYTAMTAGVNHNDIIVCHCYSLHVYVCTVVSNICTQCQSTSDTHYHHTR